MVLAIMGMVSLNFSASAAFAQNSDEAERGLDDYQSVTDTMLEQVNPLAVGGSTIFSADTTPGDILTQLLNFAFPLALLLLLAQMLWGGFEMLSESTTKKSIETGKQRIKHAIYGLLLLFTSFWIVQIVELIFGFNIFL